MGMFSEGMTGTSMSFQGLGNHFVGKREEKFAEKEMDRLKKNRPVYTVQSEYADNQNIAKNNVKMFSDLTKTNQMPGQQYAEDNLSQNSANAVSQAQMTGTTNPAILAQLSQNALQSENEGSRKLSIEGANMRQSNYVNVAQASLALESANTAMGEEKDKAWNFNINEPFQNDMDATRKRLQGAQELKQKGKDQFAAGMHKQSGAAGSAMDTYMGGKM